MAPINDTPATAVNEPSKGRRYLLLQAVMQMLIGASMLFYVLKWRTKMTYPDEVTVVTRELYISVFESRQVALFGIIPCLSIMLVLSGIGILFAMRKAK